MLNNEITSVPANVSHHSKKKNGRKKNEHAVERFENKGGRGTMQIHVDETEEEINLCE